MTKEGGCSKRLDQKKKNDDIEKSLALRIAVSKKKKNTWTTFEKELGIASGQ